MTAYDGGGSGDLFVTNVLNGTVAANGKDVAKGTVVRVALNFSVSPPRVSQEAIIGNGFEEATNPMALVLGPTGVALAPNGTLYVADTIANRVAAIPNARLRATPAGSGRTLSTGQFLKAPLGLALAPNGDILTVNGDDGEITETTPQGQQVNWIFLDTTGSPQGAGALFGLAVQPGHKGIYFVDDGENQLNLFRCGGRQSARPPQVRNFEVCHRYQLRPQRTVDRPGGPGRPPTQCKGLRLVQSLPSGTR
jgi:DNA-binding beta-propeller fold protein YncE